MIDDTWIVQRKHGRFDLAAAPKAVPEFDSRFNQQYDHWAGRLSSALPPSHANQTVAMIKDFRERYGEGQWLRAELNQLEAFKRRFRAENDEAMTFEDVRADGGSDGKWPKSGHSSLVHDYEE